MIQAGRSLRLARLLGSEDEPLLIVPMDHTVTDGPFTNARRYDEVVGILARSGADAIVVHKGRLRLIDRAAYSRLKVIVHISASTRYATDPNDKYQVADIDNCLRLGADAISVHVNMGSPTEKDQIRVLADAADACDRAGLPLLAMVYPRGPGMKDFPHVETVMHAASLAADLGADIVKLPLSGSAREMRQIVESSPIPVVSAGGSQVSDADFNVFLAQVMRSGARGIAAGRNIFMADDPARKVGEVRDVLRQNYIGSGSVSVIDLARAKPDGVEFELHALAGRREAQDGAVM